MNIWSLLYFTSFIFYVFSGVYVLSLNRKSNINIMFFFMCLTLSFWSFGYAFSTAAVEITDALKWRGVSTFGWTYFYSTMLIFFVAITNSKWTKKNIRYSFLLYIPSTIFFLRFLSYDTGNYVKSPFGWVYILYYKSIWSTAFDFYYLFCVLTCFLLLIIWRKNSESLRERKQVQIIVTTMLCAFVGGGLTDTVLPLIGVKILPMGILFTSIVISGIWFAITKYKMMNLTQEIAAEHVLITMMDPVIVMSTDFIIGQMNKAAIDLTHFLSRELIGEEANRIIKNFDEECQLAKELTSKGFINGYEIELISKSGNITPCLCSGVCVKSDYGERIGVVLVLHDITIRKVHEELIEKTNVQLQIKVAKLNNVFDNVGEGILTFNKNLLVQNEYSLECEKLFDQQIENKSFSQLIYSDNEEMEQFLNSLLLRIFGCNRELRMLYLPLLPDEVLINEKHVSIHYKFTTDEAADPIIMVILSDVTDKNALESKMDQERKILKMVTKTILNRNDFVDLIKSFYAFVEKDFHTIKNDNETLLIKIHTFKGNFSQFYMLHFIDCLDQYEEQLYNNKEFKLLDISIDALKDALKKDLEIVESYVGSGYFKEGERITIEIERLIEIEEQIRSLMNPQEIKLIMPLIRNLRNKTLHELLGNYPDYTVELGERWGKYIKPFSITGDVVYVDVKIYHELVKALVHIFRNAVSHGIETEDDRVENGKNHYGEIRCEIKETQDAIQIMISDDGRGIDVDGVEKIVLEEGLMDQEALMTLSQDEKLQIIFSHKITTEEIANTLSGRGVGLSAVKEAVNQCGGTIKVSSALNVGTFFTINIPK